jgi:transposase
MLSKDRLVLLERDNADFANRQNEQKSRSETISRENHELKIQLEQARRDHENRIRTESRQKSGSVLILTFEAEIGSLAELLEREKKKSETLEKQLGELHDQHETQQYFATLYKVGFQFPRVF